MFGIGIPYGEFADGGDGVFCMVTDGVIVLQESCEFEPRWRFWRLLFPRDRSIGEKERVLVLCWSKVNVEGPRLWLEMFDCGFERER